MELTNPAVTDGVNIFVNIVIFLVAFVGALSFIDFRKEMKKDEKEE